MTREDKDSLVEMLAKIPVTETKGSLLSAIGKLLRVIDISENSIMIPTLLKDKCEFDAYEMLTLAKILKASILGHNDLVEFYMSESSSFSSSESTISSQSSTPSHADSLGSSDGRIVNHTNHPPMTMGQNAAPETTVRLLLHIEQLKIFIPQVTGIFESIVKLYESSVDTVTYKNHSHNR
jgi:hypothetical protein